MVKGFANQEQCSNNKNEKENMASIDEIQNNLLGYVEEIEDPRVQRTQKHILKEILAIAILAVIAGSQGWEDMENYGIAKQEWLSKFLELPHGIPSDDTFRRVFERIDPESLQKCLEKWVNSIMNSIQGEIIPIDGKTLRGSYDRNKGQSARIFSKSQGSLAAKT